MTLCDPLEQAMCPREIAAAPRNRPFGAYSKDRCHAAIDVPNKSVAGRSRATNVSEADSLAGCRRLSLKSLEEKPIRIAVRSHDAPRVHLASDALTDVSRVVYRRFYRRSEPKSTNESPVFLEATSMSLPKDRASVGCDVPDRAVSARDGAGCDEGMRLAL
jgi:hypothetical protein